MHLRRSIQTEKRRVKVVGGFVHAHLMPRSFNTDTNTAGDCTSTPRLSTSCVYPITWKGKMQDGPLQSPCVLEKNPQLLTRD